MKDMEEATAAKSLVEDAQREQRRYMEESGKKYEPRFFQLGKGRWTPKLMYILFLPFQVDLFDFFNIQSAKRLPRSHEGS
jgi:hypothetical protein